MGWRAVRSVPQKNLMGLSCSQMPPLRQEKLLCSTDSVPMVTTTVSPAVLPAWHAIVVSSSLFRVLWSWTGTATCVRTPTLLLGLTFEGGTALRVVAQLLMLPIPLDLLVFFFTCTATLFCSCLIMLARGAGRGSCCLRA